VFFVPFVVQHYLLLMAHAYFALCSLRDSGTGQGLGNSVVNPVFVP
jgi:hypothetical protein